MFKMLEKLPTILKVKKIEATAIAPKLLIGELSKSGINFLINNPKKMIGIVPKVIPKDRRKS
jgi:hypothetical protein